MDQVKPFLSQNGLPNGENLPPDLDLVNNQPSNGIIVKENQLADGNKVPAISDDGPTDVPPKSPVRGLELIYKVAEELATRIADEKRYEGIIKPCFVEIQRISDASQYKIIRDETLIMDESINDTKLPTKGVTNNEDINQIPEDMQTDCYNSSDDEEEIILPPIDDNDEKNESPIEKITFSCIFCQQKNLLGKSTAIDHYHTHLDYYPYKCALCLEVTTNLKNLFIHYRKEHSEEKTATFKKKLMPWISEWIDDFLKSQLMSFHRGRGALPRPYCPVCEISEKKEDIIMLPPNLIQPRKHMMHIYKHLLYEPFVCLICQKAGEKFTACDYEERVYEHILKRHPEAEDELLSKIFQKSRYIKPLERYVLHYLTTAGVSTKRRIPEKIPLFTRNKYKAKQEVKEKDKIDKDINRSVTLGDLANQSSTSLLNDQSDVMTIGQKIDNPNNLSNQTKVNLNTTFISHQTNKTPPIVHKPTSMLVSANSLISPIKGPIKAPSTQLASLTVNGMTNIYTVTAVSVLPQNQTINGLTTQHQPNVIPTYQQQPKIIQLPCGQVMVRNSPPTPAQSPPESILKHPPNYGRSLLQSPPAILRRATITSPTREPKQNGPVEVIASPDVGSFISSDVIIKKKQEDDFVKKNYFCMFCKELVRFDTFIEGLFHFSKHLDYNPVNCLLCSDQFPDIGSIMRHFAEVHSHDKVCQDSVGCEPLLYYINRDGQTEKWLEQYLYFQVSGELERLANGDSASFCTICKSIINNTRLPTRATSKKFATMTPPIEVVRQHLNLHINYRPYECYLCSKAGNQIKFASIGETAIKHLKTHGFTPVDKNFCKEFFNFKPIEGLENFIKNYLITEYYPYANTLGHQENINKTQIVDRSASFTNGVNNHKTYQKPSGLDIPKRLFTEQGYTNGSISSPPFPSPSPSSSSSSSQNRDLNKSTKTVLACYHCKLTINGFQELVTHCKTIHPNLSIASYRLPTFNGID